MECIREILNGTQYQRIAESITSMPRKKAMLLTALIFIILSSIGAAVLICVLTANRLNGHQARGLVDRDVVLITAMTTVSITETIIPTKTISIFHFTTHSPFQNLSLTISTVASPTSQTVSTTLTAALAASSRAVVRNPINTASLAGIFVGIVCVCLIVGIILLYTSRRMDKRGLRFWPIGVRKRTRMIPGSLAQPPTQSISHVPSQRVRRVPPSKKSHKDSQIVGRPEPDAATFEGVDPANIPLPRTPPPTVPQINVFNASGTQVLGTYSLSNGVSAGKALEEEHGESPAEESHGNASEKARSNEHEGTPDRKPSPTAREILGSYDLEGWI